MYRNSEYYPDPTFDEAYKNICRRQRMLENPDWIYIASPYKGDVKRNTANAKKYAGFAVRSGKLPICPHIYFTRFLNDNNKTEREIGMSLALQMLKKCREIWVFGERISSGMDREIRYARKWKSQMLDSNISHRNGYKAISTITGRRISQNGCSMAT